MWKMYVFISFTLCELQPAAVGTNAEEWLHLVFTRLVSDNDTVIDIS